MAKKTVEAKRPAPQPKQAAKVKYEPPKLTRFEKLERLIVAGE
jgi:hypothetical protein